PINFAYSLLAALLAGNASIVKASSLGFAQTRIVAGHMRQLLASSHAALTPYVNVIQYERDRQDVTEELSALCDARVIWGGDETVRRVRMAPLSPLAFDVTFGDRYSLLAVSAAHVLGMTDAELEKAAQGFYNDTYLYDQNACTTPRLVYWVGSGAEITLAKPRFWEAVRAYAATRYPIPAVMAVDKRMAVCRAALTLPGGARQSPMPDNVVTRVQVAELTDETEALRCAGGLFAEYDAQSLDALAPYVRRKFQTLSYLGLDPREIRAWALGKGLRGIDRIVPVGHTMDFSLTWDGYDLISTLSRVIDLPKEAR
ncbi:MAG: acyl-CoA reductase, partial [Clostridia bacterium]|nr:acyl-CoA reductase [Clostridia bacterium]